MPEKNQENFSSLIPELQKFAPHRNEAEIRSMIGSAIEYLNSSQALESVAPSAEKLAEKDTQKTLNSTHLSKDKNMENNDKTAQEDKPVSKDKAVKTGLSTLAPELLPLVTRHLQAAGLPNHFIDLLHDTAFGKKSAAPAMTAEVKKTPKKPNTVEAKEDDQKNLPVVAPMASDGSHENDYNPEDILSAYVQRIKSR